MKTFDISKTYQMRSIGDSNVLWDVTIAKRTAKTITTVIDGRVRTVKIHQTPDGEIAFPLGRYSMAPTLRA